jgi:hypothetical protein
LPAVLGKVVVLAGLLLDFAELLPEHVGQYDDEAGFDCPHDAQT